MAVAVTLGNTLGALFLGLIGWAILFGAISMQVVTYYSNFPNDWRHQKIVVGMLMAVSVIHLAFAIYSIYCSLFSNLGNTDTEGGITWTFKVATSLDSAVVLIVQGLYAWRVYTLGKHFSRVWPCVVVVIVSVGWAFGIALPIEFAKLEEWNGVHELHSLVVGGICIPLVIDAILAGSLCYYLHRSRSILTRTNSILLRIARYVIVCGFLTSACALATLICAITMSDNMIFLAIEFLLPRLYLFSYMALLNARKTITDNDIPSFDVSAMVNAFRSGHTSTSTSTSAQPLARKPTIAVKGEMGTDQDSDAIPLSVSKYDPEVLKAPQRASLQHRDTDIGV